MNYYKGCTILLRNLKKATVVKKIKNDYLVNYYIDNKLVHDLITEYDIIDEDEYEIIKNRINLINKLI